MIKFDYEKEKKKKDRCVGRNNRLIVAWGFQGLGAFFKRDYFFQWTRQNAAAELAAC